MKIKATVAIVCTGMAITWMVAPSFKVHQNGIVLITGASSGIGLHGAKHLTTFGYTVLAGVRKESDFDAITQLHNPLLIPVKVDVTNHQSCVAAMESVKTLSKKSNLPFIALVNNAGVSRRNIGEFHDVQDAKQVFETNFFGLLDLTQLSLPLLRESKGRIIMISSLAGVFSAPMSSIYSASKFAVEGFTDGLRREVESFGISVSLIEPAYVKTEIFGKSAAKVKEVVVDNPQMALVYPNHYSEKAFQKRENTLAKASDPIVTSTAMHHAITASRPNTRYFVANYAGIPCNILASLIPLIPDRLLDAIFKVM